MASTHDLRHDLSLARTMVVSKIACAPTCWSGVSLCVYARCAPPLAESSQLISRVVSTLLCRRKCERMDHVRLFSGLPSHPSPRVLERTHATPALAARN